MVGWRRVRKAAALRDAANTTFYVMPSSGWKAVRRGFPDLRAVAFVRGSIPAALNRWQAPDNHSPARDESPQVACLQQRGAGLRLLRESYLLWQQVKQVEQTVFYIMEPVPIFLK